MQPLSPTEVAAKFKLSIDPLVIQAVNELLVENYNKVYITLMQKDIIARYSQLKGVAIGEQRAVERDLDFEDVFRANGWDVTYDKPAYCENYEPNFTFKSRKK